MSLLSYTSCSRELVGCAERTKIVYIARKLDVFQLTMVRKTHTTRSYSSTFVMLSDPSTDLEAYFQGFPVTINGVETSDTVKRYFDSVLDSSTQTDSATSFYFKSLNMTKYSETE
jgi:hypothetical protein